jgi:hypothetical protein
MDGAMWDEAANGEPSHENQLISAHLKFVPNL